MPIDYPSRLKNWQKQQQLHDELCHADILRMPMRQRLNHYLLHFVKYQAAFRSKEEVKLLRTLIDACIVTIAAANALSIDLEVFMKRQYLTHESEQAFFTELRQAAKASTPTTFLDAFANNLAQIARILEQTEHKPEQEPIALKRIEKEVEELFLILLRKGLRQKLDPQTLVTRALERNRQERQGQKVYAITPSLPKESAMHTTTSDPDTTDKVPALSPEIAEQLSQEIQDDKLGPHSGRKSNPDADITTKMRPIKVEESAEGKPAKKGELPDI